MKDYLVYIWRDPTPGGLSGRFHKVRYVGKGAGKRPYDWHKRNPAARAWFLELKAQGRRPIVEVLWSGLDEATAYGYEVALIEFYRASPRAGDLLNVTDGGPGKRGVKPSAETLALVSAKLTGRKLSPDHVEKLRAAGAERTHLPESVEKIVAFHTGRKRSPETRERMRQAAIARHTNELEPDRAARLAKIAASKTGRALSPEHAAGAAAGRLASRQARAAPT